jgi:5'-nucleotidase
MTDRPLILASNDDGVDADGLRELREALEPFADVYVVAPEFEQSAKSHAISLHTTLRHHRYGPKIHSVEGTPADCVYVALYRKDLLPRWPDLVVSGINHGANLATDVHYSGTVAAAREAALRGIPSIAFSLLPGGVMALAGKFAAEIVQRVLSAPRPIGQPPFLNVNFPAGVPNGIRATRLGIRIYREGVDVRTDPRGREYYWMGGPNEIEHPPIAGSDTEAADAGYVSITPLRLEMTQTEHTSLAHLAAGTEAP